MKRSEGILYEVRRTLALQDQAEKLLNEPAWSLLKSYRKLIGGRRSGIHVSALAAEQQLAPATKLATGETVKVHLIHRHVSGKHEPSRLQWNGNELVMVFADGEYPA